MNDDKKITRVVYILGVIPVIWLALLVAPYINGGLIEIIKNGSDALSNPFNITFMESSIKAILIFLLIYIMSILVYESTRKNYRRREENGSAKWGEAKDLNKKYKQPNNYNKILTKNVSLGLNGKKHRRNVNGEIVRDTGHLLEQNGYEVRVLDLINMEKSHCYNPFVYLKSDNDVQKLVTNLFKSTTPKGSSTNDPFWDTAASMLLLALIFYLKYEAPEEEQNFVMVMELLRAGDVKEDDDDYVSPLDMLFNRLETTNPEHISLKYYRAYHSGSAKTLKSIQVTLAARLEKFNLESVAQLTQTDELDLPSLGEKKVALFAIIPDNDTSFNFLVSVLYTQLFQQLFYLADYKYGGSLPVHVHFVMDEFANVSLPDDFDKILSVMRSREVSVSIILQNLAQLKALFEKQWESIVGNCDEFLYLGGNEQSTHKYVSELLGKETIDTNTFGRTFGSHGNYSKNDQIAGRELLTPDEVRMLDNQYALLFVRGERPVKDFKFNLKEHFNSINTPIGNKSIKPYIHGDTSNAIGTISFNFEDNINMNEVIDLELKETDYELLSEEEIDNLFKEDIESANININ